MKRGSRTLIERSFPPDVTRHLLSLERVFVSFSGGVDSTCILALLAGVVPQGGLRALNFASFLHFPHEAARCQTACDKLGVPLDRVPGPELADRRVTGNDGRRCAYCKAARLEEAARRAEAWDAVIVDGTNADDLKDGTRLGNAVLATCQRLFSPFAEGDLDKAAVRRLARKLEIPWADEAATACLATRFPHGVELDDRVCRQVAGAEEALRATGLACRLRVCGLTVCVEPMPPVDWAGLDRELIVKTLKTAGYERVMLDLEGYVTGRSWLA